MSDPDLLAQRLEWFAAGESRLLGLLAAAPRDLRAPSLLPGWSRAQLVAHLIGNADALGNLVHWARTGEPTPMYPSTEARAAQIARDGDRSDGWLLDQVRASSERLAAALAAMTGADWNATVRTVMGREVGAVEIPWMRVRESAIHALDLDLGAGLAGCPAALVDALITDVSATVGAREGCPTVLLAPHDRDRTWRLGPETGPDNEPDAEPLTVDGSAAELLTWVVGRSPAALPALPRWL